MTRSRKHYLKNRKRIIARVMRNRLMARQRVAVVQQLLSARWA